MVGTKYPNTNIADLSKLFHIVIKNRVCASKWLLA
jgi:hypothetical protein